MGFQVPLKEETGLCRLLDSQRRERRVELHWEFNIQFRNMICSFSMPDLYNVMVRALNEGMISEVDITYVSVLRILQIVHRSCFSVLTFIYY